MSPSEDKPVFPKSGFYLLGHPAYKTGFTYRLGAILTMDTGLRRYERSGGRV